jgi:hypothetical protein
MSERIDELKEIMPNSFIVYPNTIHVLSCDFDSSKLLSWLKKQKFSFEVPTIYISYSTEHKENFFSCSMCEHANFVVYLTEKCNECEIKFFIDVVNTLYKYRDELSICIDDNCHKIESVTRTIVDIIKESNVRFYMKEWYGFYDSIVSEEIGQPIKDQIVGISATTNIIIGILGKGIIEKDQIKYLAIYCYTGGDDPLGVINVFPNLKKLLLFDCLSGRPTERDLRKLFRTIKLSKIVDLTLEIYPYEEFTNAFDEFPVIEKLTCSYHPDILRQVYNKVGILNVRHSDFYAGEEIEELLENKNCTIFEINGVVLNKNARNAVRKRKMIHDRAMLLWNSRFFSFTNGFIFGGRESLMFTKEVSYNVSRLVSSFL